MTEFQQVPKKLYIFTRADLPPGLQLAQAVHAGTQFVLDYPELSVKWDDEWKNLVCLQVPDEDELLNVLDVLTGWCGPHAFIDAPHSYFVEPDLGGEHTSVAALLTDQQAKRFKNLSLSLRTKSPRGGEV